MIQTRNVMRGSWEKLLSIPCTKNVSNAARRRIQVVLWESNLMPQDNVFKIIPQKRQKMPNPTQPVSAIA
jgi:hypothetical protein